MTTPTSDVKLPVHRPLGASSEVPIVPNTTRQTAAVASEALPCNIPLVRGGPSAESKVILFPYPPPTFGKNIRTLRDLLPPEDPPDVVADMPDAVVDMQKAVREVTGSLEELTSKIISDHEIRALLLNNAVQLGAGTEGMIERVDRLIEMTAELQKNVNEARRENEQKHQQQEEQIEFLDQMRCLDRPKIPLVSEANFLERNWKIIGVSALSVINFVAITVIFGIAAAVLLSTALMIGTAFWTQYLNRITTSEKPNVF